MRVGFACIVFVEWSVAASGLVGCGSQYPPPPSSSDAGNDSSLDSGNVSVNDARNDVRDSAGSDSDATPSPRGLRIVAAGDAALQGAPGDAIQLQVVFVLKDGGTLAIPEGRVNWTAPETIAAEDPNGPGTNELPAAGRGPTAFFVTNEYRQTHEGVLYVVASGTSSDEGVKVTASVADGGTVSATVAISRTTLVGDPTRGGEWFQFFGCSNCHGPSGGGSPASDGGEAGAVYQIPIEGGDLFSYPAPALNDTSTDAGPNLAADPAWSAGLLGMSSQADIDNAGVALRAPMPDFFMATTPDGGKPPGAQDFADIYAWLKTQTQ